MKSLAFAAVFLSAIGVSAARADNAAPVSPFYLVIVSTGTTPNTGGGLATLGFATKKGCEDAKSALGAVAPGGNAMVSGACLTYQ